MKAKAHLILLVASLLLIGCFLQIDEAWAQESNPSIWIDSESGLYAGCIYHCPVCNSYHELPEKHQSDDMADHKSPCTTINFGISSAENEDISHWGNFELTYISGDEGLVKFFNGEDDNGTFVEEPTVRIDPDNPQSGSIYFHPEKPGQAAYRLSASDGATDTSDSLEFTIMVQEHKTPTLSFNRPKHNYYLVGETEDESALVKNSNDLFGEGEIHSTNNTTARIKSITSSDSSVFSVVKNASQQDSDSIKMKALRSGNAVLTVTDILDQKYEIHITVKDIDDIDTSVVRFNTHYDDVTYLVKDLSVGWSHCFENADLLHHYLWVESTNQNVIQSNYESSTWGAGSLLPKSTGTTTLNLYYIKPEAWPNIENDDKVFLRSISATVLEKSQYENILNISGWNNTYYPQQIEVGQSVSCLDPTYSLMPHALIFESSDSNVIEISDTGIATARKNGYATLSARFESLGKNASTSHSTLRPIMAFTPIKKITLNKEKVTLDVGEQFQLVATTFPENCSNKTLHWDYWFHDTPCVDVSSTGLISAKLPGNATVRVWSDEDPSIDKTCNITVRETKSSENKIDSAAAKPIKQTSLAKASVTVKAKTYTGKTLKPSSVTVKLGGKTLRQGTDYTVSCKGGKAVGSYAVTIKGRGAYAGTAAAKFQIVPKGVSAKKPAAAKRGFTATWARPSSKYLKQTTGYQVSWSTDKKFKKGVKSTLVKGAKKTTLKVGKLKAKKTYYVKVRAYKQVGKMKCYSAWSKAQKVKTR